MVKPVLHNLDDTSLNADNPTFVNSSSLIAYIHTTNIELVKHFMSLYPDKKLTWDHFFQFTLLCTCASTINLFYYVEYNRISWDNIRQASLILKTVADCGAVYRQEFGRCDVNNDGFLTFQQFILLVSKNKSVWNPICQFRKLMQEHIFHIDQALIILERRLKLPEIKLYQKYHNNQLPKLSCSKQMHLLFSSEPHPLLYHFDYMDELNTSCSRNRFILTGEELSLEMLTMISLNYIRPATSIYRLVFNTDSISRILTGPCDDIDMYFMSRVKRQPLNNDGPTSNNNNNNNNNNQQGTVNLPSRSNSISKTAAQQRLSLKEGDGIKKNSILRRSTFTNVTPLHRPSSTPMQLPLNVERTRGSGYYTQSNLVSRQTSINQNGLLSRQTSCQPSGNNNNNNNNNNNGNNNNNTEVLKKSIVPPLNQINTLNYVRSNNDGLSPHLVSPSSPTRIVVSSRANTYNI